ncbi:hypothetical protein BIW11_04526 [Tropilaelaps mercedesae]|uniref:Uncharacterized protein n=1 Tax=Tropilaelaps mercedesae TaxID=418985 RepID=A0A1V9X549_9ACAR|nr:hypothetical protein BIW11_04526 [Tropilaelaps mercedesae]
MARRGLINGNRKYKSTGLVTMLYPVLLTILVYSSPDSA